MNSLFKSIAICSLAALPLYGTIYMRLKGNAYDSIVSAGATEIARHEALVNGYKATLTVLAFNEPIERAVENIRRATPEFPPLKAGKVPYVSGAWITSRDTETQCDLIFMPGLNDAGQCSAWLVEKDSKQKVPEPMPGVNPLPDAALVSWLYDKTQSTLLSVHDSDSDLNSAFTTAIDSMEEEGWIPVAKGETTAMLVKNDFPASITVYKSGTLARTAIVRHQ